MTGRVPIVDLARTVALLAMGGFHLGVDLELFGFLAPGTTRMGAWPVAARAIAGSFLFLAGVSLWLAHGQGIRWRAFLRRLGVLILAAGAVSLGTWAAMPKQFVYFGILHSIAAASVIGLAFLRLPAGVTLAAAALALWLPGVARSAAFDSPWLWWTGLSTWTRPSMDFEPVLPWVAPALAGMACARLAACHGLWPAIARAGTGLPRWLGWPGRHSLAVYLIHQPVLLGLVALAALLAD